MLMGGKPEAIFAECLKKLVETSNTILDIATSQRLVKELRPYESWFNGKNYIAAGYQPVMNYGKYNCDCHQDIEQITFDDHSFEAIICLDVLEHVSNPFKAVKEIKRVLKPSGKLLLSVPFLSQYHGKGGSSQSHEDYPDFWRFTHQGLQLLFDDFQSVEVFPLDGPIEFRLKQFYCTRFLKNSLVRKIVDAIDRPRLSKATSRHLVFGTQ